MTAQGKDSINKIREMLTWRDDIDCSYNYENHASRPTNNHIPIIFFIDTQHGTARHSMMIDSEDIDTRGFKSCIIIDIDKAVKKYLDERNPSPSTHV